MFTEHLASAQLYIRSSILAKAGLKKMLNEEYMMGKFIGNERKKSFRVRLNIKGENKM